MKRIILFGGSFNPIHFGHLHMAKAAYEAVEADEVIFIPAKKPRWKEAPERDEDRLAMLKLALKAYPYFHLSLLEMEDEDGGHYTIETVKKLVKQYKEQQEEMKLYYLIGEDQLERLHEWHEIDELMNLVQFLSYGRNDEEWSSKADFNASIYHVIQIKGKTSYTSSTAIRELQSIDIPKAVLRYIMEKKLYRYGEVFSFMNEKRYIHSCSVALLAYQIAKKNHYRPFEAFLAGLLHDIGKTMEKEEAGRKIMEEHYPHELDLPIWSYHQFIGAYLAKTIFGVQDQEIVSAIEYHCTGKEKMTRLGKIIYASDKIDPKRGYDSKYMIDACLQDDEEGFRFVLKENKKFLESKSKEIHNRYSDACFTYYLKERE